MEETLYSITDVANLLDLHVKTVRRYVQDGRLKATRVGKQYRIAQSDLDAFLGKSGKSSNPRIEPSVEVSSVIEISAISRTDADRLAIYLTASAKHKSSEQPLKIETLFYEEHNRMKVMVLGNASDTTAIIDMVQQLTVSLHVN